MRDEGVVSSVLGSGTALFIQLCHRRFNWGTSSRWHTWAAVFTTLCFLWGPGCDAEREETCWSLKSLLPGFPQRCGHHKTDPLNTRWRAQSQTSGGNNRPAAAAPLVALHRVMNRLNVVLSLCNHQLVRVVFNKWISGKFWLHNLNMRPI